MKTNDFLKDIFITSLSAFGGPEAHYGVITDQLVIRKKYLDEKELIELIALCTILPGPTSTQTVVPLMMTELVDIKGYLTSGEFLTGYGLVQGMPGPMFSFSAYAGGMALRGNNFIQVMGALVSGVAIFLPGLLLIYFVYPIWENLKKIKAVKISLAGISAVAGGLIAATAISLMQENAFKIDNISVVIVTSLLLFTKKIPAPIIVVLVLLLGVL